MTYLYGASIQGIQSFIFSTKELKNIVNASAVVEEISTRTFKRFIPDIPDSNILLNAAGNIKLLAKDQNQLKKLVHEFPKYVMKTAPGITVSQAVVQCNGDPVKNDYFELEKRLKIQRNKPIRPLGKTALGIVRSGKTGKSAVKKEGSENIDATVNSLKQNKNNNDIHKKLNEKLLKTIPDTQHHFPQQFSDITDQKTSNWLAVIHADCNSLGKKIQQLIKEKGPETFREFSEKLNNATIKAASIAFEQEIASQVKNNHYPIQPLIIGGDDLTVICRADLALKFTAAYLKNFEKETAGTVGKLTACAGISYVKEKYPFHYAVDLAEDLCKTAKKESKRINQTDVPSSLIFHKVQSSFSDDYHTIEKRDLTVDASSVKFSYGPYGYNHEKLASLKELNHIVSCLQSKDSPKSGLRQWLSELHNDKNSAIQLLNRIKKITSKNFAKDLNLKKEIEKLKTQTTSKTIFYDALTLCSLEGGE